MNRNVFAILVLGVILSSGCATQKKTWYKPNATSDQFMRDQMECRKYGMQSAMANGLAGNMFVEIWVSRETESCLANLGYTTQASQ